MTKKDHQKHLARQDLTIGFDQSTGAATGGNTGVDTGGIAGGDNENITKNAQNMIKKDDGGAENDNDDDTTPRTLPGILPDQIQEFSWSNLPEYFTMGILAKRGSGKTYLLRHIVYQTKNWYTEAWLFSNSAHLQKEDYDYIPKDHQVQGLDLLKLRAIVEQQKRFLKYNETIQDSKKRIKSEPLIIFDDVIADSKIKHMTDVDDLFITGRHYKINVIYLSQTVKGFSKSARTNTDVAVAFYIHNELDRKTITEEYLSLNGFRAGEALLKSVTTEPYQAIVMQLRKPNIRTFQDYVYKYTAPATKPKFLVKPDKKVRGTLDLASEKLLTVSDNATRFASILRPADEDTGDVVGSIRI